MARKRTRPNILIDEDCYLSIKNLSKDDFYNLFMAVLAFGFERKEPTELSGALEASYLLITKKMLRAQNRYDACVSNGRKGGAPTGNSNAKKKQPEYNQTTTKIQPKNNQKHNQKTTKGTTKPSIETETESETESETPNDNKTKNIFSLNNCEGVRAREYAMNTRSPLLPEVYYYHEKDIFGLAMLEITDTLLEAIEFANSKGSIKYNSDTYTADEFADIVQKFGKKLIQSIAFKIANDETIKNKPTYILGCLLSLKSQDEIKSKG